MTIFDLGLVSALPKDNPAPLNLWTLRFADGATVYYDAATWWTGCHRRPTAELRTALVR